YWCGNPSGLDFVMSNIDTLVVKPVNRVSGRESIYGALLSADAKKNLLEKIASQPMQFVAQAVLDSANLPTCVDGMLQPRPAILRSFAVASDSSYTIMPGGLTRVGLEPSAFIISNQTGARSKDTWVIASEPERIGKRQTSESDGSTVNDADLISLPSRVVENLFWMGRYAERAEASLRLVRTVLIMLNGEEPVKRESKMLLLEAITHITATYPGFVGAENKVIDSPESELSSVIGDASRIGSIRSSLNAMLNCVDESKELLSSDTLRVTNDIRDALADLDNPLDPTGIALAPEETLDVLVTALLALSGLAQESMTRGIGWRFMEIGRRLERALLTTATIRHLLVQEMPEQQQNTLIHAMLLSLEALINYRRRYRARLGVQSSLDLVMMDTTNPRSLLYQLDQLNRHLQTLSKAQESRHELSPEIRATLEAESIIKLSILTELSAREDGQRKLLEKNLGKVTDLLVNASNIISQKYFDHKEVSRQLVRSVSEKS
ncbi:MAG: circularly permuted type 2 ATP-grasp protein, partial [Pseudomonadales bacterium]|nr:circularly permuted type 2 ATP-grasp protein [Pseudomonadales bacterium]